MASGTAFGADSAEFQTLMDSLPALTAARATALSAAILDRDIGGARSGPSHFKPDRFYTHSDLRAAGYVLLAGSLKNIGVTSSQEAEDIWLRVK